MCRFLGNDAMKPSKLQDHQRRCHPDKTEKDLKYFQTLKDKFQRRPTLDRMFASTSQRIDDGLLASYNISLLTAKSGKPHTIGEKLILPAVEEVLKTVLHKPASDIVKRIPLSNNTVERRIDETSSDIESFLCNYLQTTHFSIQLDESTLPDNAALLLAYVRFIVNQEIYEELLFARTFITDTVMCGKDTSVPVPWSLCFRPARAISGVSDFDPARRIKCYVRQGHIRSSLVVGLFEFTKVDCI
ncbi:unnamed protein product [Acanthoscelides obtectus]|uniref:Uncharacterized protein n=1 Tax=Acanthoscelides obtectus TaxID=200917 RepID=A0A9P0KN83_ACAOB|nr:unnamed protein product [Acanthoscelides obtectus]CAK1685026.1 SCAN domain-containing protein 3 [Acanthoscelides obtectus]